MPPMLVTALVSQRLLMLLLNDEAPSKAELRVRRAREVWCVSGRRGQGWMHRRNSPAVAEVGQAPLTDVADLRLVAAVGKSEALDGSVDRHRVGAGLL